ncbi:hypothetical protein [Paraburkholderia sp. Cpub6]|uniref:hypothetical protein n=1 Tax=Paraburkholderia sp. Cpub6 TaxID=2723094 RepID=UPI00178F093C|nr:hypothetical protein [Paraburkholderia sp. Cpub6]MBB5460286.1 hypothetical protein [Paraburkholderia sp. Cpub6]
MERSSKARLSSPAAAGREEDLQRKLKALSPRSDEQRQHQAGALRIVDEVLMARWLRLPREKGTISVPLAVVLVSRLAMIFGTVGLFALFNGAIVAIVIMGALSTSEALFLILADDCAAQRRCQNLAYADARCDRSFESLAAIGVPSLTGARLRVRLCARLALRYADAKCAACISD